MTNNIPTITTTDQQEAAWKRASIHTAALTIPQGAYVIRAWTCSGDCGRIRRDTTPCPRHGSGRISPIWFATTTPADAAELAELLLPVDDVPEPGTNRLGPLFSVLGGGLAVSVATLLLLV